MVMPNIERISGRINLKKVSETVQERTFVATVLDGYYAKMHDQEGREKIVWIEELRMLDIVNLDERGVETPRTSKVSVQTYSGRDAGKGSALELKVQAYEKLGRPMNEGEIDPAINKGLTFKYTIHRHEYGKNRTTGEVMFTWVDIPSEQLDNYVYPGDALARPVWRRNAREEDSSAPSIAAAVASAAPAPMSEDDLDAALAKALSGTNGEGMEALQRASAEPALRKIEILESVRMGTAAPRLVEKGLLKQGADGLYVLAA